MSFLPREVLVLLSAGFLSRTVNRQPPLWERLLSGLTFYDAPYRADVENVVVLGTRAAVRPVSCGCGPAGHLERRA
jgi:hypothetical protein